MLANAETTLREVETAARAIGLQIQVFNASTSRRNRRGLRNTCARAARCALRRPRPFLQQPAHSTGPTGGAPRDPSAYPARDFAEAGGLMSYGANIADAYRQVGVYAGRILKGVKPADCRSCSRPSSSWSSTLETARMLGLDVPPIAARPRRRGDRMRAARVHHAARRRGGGVAARGAGAAGRRMPADRRVS